MKIETPAARPSRLRRLAGLGLIVSAAFAVGALGGPRPADARPPEPVGTDFGDPLPGLTAA